MEVDRCFFRSTFSTRAYSTGDLEVKDRILASDNNLIIGHKTGADGVDNLTTLDVYADATKFKGTIQGTKLILTDNVQTYFRVGTDNIPEYSRDGSTYYDFITRENHKQDVDSVNLVITGGASGTATHTIEPDSTYSITVSGLNASYLNSGTIAGARLSSNGSIYSHVTVGKAAYATQAQKANIASQLNGLSSTSGTLATQAWVNSALSGSVPPGSIMPFAGVSIPSGWLLCNGSWFNASTYPKLYAALKSNYLPDLDDDVFLQGSTGYNRNIIQPGLPNITGYAAAPCLTDSLAFSTSGAFYNAGQTGMWNAGHANNSHSWALGFAASRSNAIYGRSSTVQPKAVKVRYIIKY